MSKYWSLIWSGVLAISWILPNHYRPWVSFHLDAWMALTLLIAGFSVSIRSSAPLVLHRIVALFAILACIPLVQYGFGQIRLPGSMWISSIYLLGLMLSVIVGARWEAMSRDQLCDTLFLAIGIASIISVGLQLQQWLQIDGIELWKMGGDSERPHANFGQPNMLGSFLLWGLLAVGWGWQRRNIGCIVASLMCAFLCFGIALTGSRTAWISLTIIILASSMWRNLWRSNRVPWFVAGLGAFFVACVLGQADLKSAILGNGTRLPDIVSVVSGQSRLSAWTVFVDAIGQRPWFGYGWYQVVPAQLDVATRHPSLQGVFTSAHNLFLDLFLWVGIPVGLVISFCLLAWGWKKVCAVRHAEEAILVLFLAVIANHSMLELPLHFAYILLPVGLVIGVLATRMNDAPILVVSRWYLIILLTISTLFLTLIIRDYSRIETNYANYRLERIRIKVAHLEPPDVLLLTQWRDFLELAYSEPNRKMSIQEIDHVRDVAEFFAGPLLIHKLAVVLALNNQREEAKLWLIRMCKSSPDDDCNEVKKVWNWESRRFPEVNAIPWPIGEASQ